MPFPVLRSGLTILYGLFLSPVECHLSDGPAGSTTLELPLHPHGQDVVNAGMATKPWIHSQDDRTIAGSAQELRFRQATVSTRDSSVARGTWFVTEMPAGSGGTSRAPLFARNRRFDPVFRTGTCNCQIRNAWKIDFTPGRDGTIEGFSHDRVTTTISSGTRSMMKPSRREFLSSTVAGVALGTIPVLPGNDALTIVDCHQHLWPDWSALPWLNEADADAKLKHRFWVDEYRKAIGEHNVEAVYMEVDTAEDDKDKEVARISELCTQGTAHTQAAVVGGFPGRDYFAEYARRHAKNPVIKGFRQVLHGSAPKGTCLEPSFVRDVQLLGELGCSFDLCMRPGELTDGAKLARACSDTRFIVDHCGNADPKAWRPSSDPEAAKATHTLDEWKHGMEMLSREPNVICKISGIIARVPEAWSVEDLAPVVDHCLDLFGPNRVIFGSDWPVCLLGASLLEWIDALHQIVSTRTKKEQRHLWSANAKRFYDLA